MQKKHYLIGIIVISIFFLVQSIWSMREKTATFDEIGHVAAGYSFLKYNDYRLYDVDPPLMRQIAALPLMFMNLNFPLHSAGWNEKKEIDVGYDFFYKMNGRKADTMLFWARLPIVLFSLLFGFVLLKFAADLWNVQTGLFAFFLYSFEPNILANSRLATTDMGLAFFIMLSVYFTYRYWKKPSWKNVLAIGVSFGLAIASKTPGMILIPFFFVVLLIVRPFVKNADSSFPFSNRLKMVYFNKKIGIYLLHWIAILLVGFFVLSMDYGFFKTWAVFRDDNDLQKFELSLDKLKIHSPQAKEVAVNLARRVRVPARPFIVSFVKWFGFLPRSKDEGKVQGYRPFFHGKRGKFFEFPFVVFLIKEPIPIILLILMGSILLIFYDFRKFLFLFLPILFILSMDLKVHPWTYRYINLLILPFLILIGSSVLYYKIAFKKRVRFGIGLMAVWLFIESLVIFPNYLVYFNELIGGPSQGHNYLVNSNLDWGQDLKRLKKYLDQNHIEEVNLSYFGSADPDYYHIHYKKMLGVNGRETGEETSEEIQRLTAPRLGFIAISATCLENIEGFFPGASYDWLKKYKPMANIGYSIFIYNIKDFSGKNEG